MNTRQILSIWDVVRTMWVIGGVCLFISCLIIRPSAYLEPDALYCIGLWGLAGIGGFTTEMW